MLERYCREYLFGRDARPLDEELYGVNKTYTGNGSVRGFGDGIGETRYYLSLGHGKEDGSGDGDNVESGDICSEIQFLRQIRERNAATYN